MSGNDRWFAIPAGAVFLLAGALTIFLTKHFAGRKLRILRNGSVTAGKVIKVRPTNVEINGRRRYEVVFEIGQDDQVESMRSNIYAGIEKAQSFEKSGEAVRLLVDPKDNRQVVCLDFLLVTN